MFTTEDGAEVVEGGLYWDYYDQKPCRIQRLGGTEGGFAGWHDVELYDKEDPSRMLRTTILDGSRMCSLEAAIRYGHASEDQVRLANLAHQCPNCWSVPCSPGCTGTD